MRRWCILLMVLILPVLFASRGALADEEGAGPEITLEQAINMALERDESLKKAALEVDKLEQQRNDVAERVKFIPAMGTVYNSDIEQAWYGLLQADLQWQMSKKSLQMARDALALKVANAYWNVQAAEEELKVQQLLEKQTLLNLQNARIGLQVGTVSSTEVVTAETKYQQAKAGVSAAQRALDDAYNAFNALVGLDSSKRPVLIDAPQYQPLEVVDLEAEVSKKVEGSPTIWLAEQKITLQKWAVDMPSYGGAYTPYKVREIELEQRELDAAATRKQMENSIRDLYFKLKAAEERYRSAEESLKSAWESLRVTRVKYELGMATQAEVLAKEVEVARAQQELDNSARQHASLKMAFEKPWAALGGNT